ncbi:NUDIX hydrolase [Candidatus Woesearchaeota archaeon]|nr:NUDIX hydrolase [Candidatus Woesearchaeota archaeon]
MVNIISTGVAVYAVIVNDNNEFLLTQGGPKKNLDDKWHFPGGRLEKDENDIDGLKREVKEELGIEITDILVKFARYVTRGYNWKPTTKPRIAVFFLAKLKKGEKIKIDKEEISAFKWYKKSDIDYIDFWLTWYKEMLNIILPNKKP